jgi:protein arginine N-methyltransferase 1
MSCIKSWALREPLVDHVDSKTINSNACPILDVDLKTVKVGELDFSHQYKLKIHRDDYIHGFVGWFDVSFSSCHMPIKLSTSPFGTSTHWK